MLKPILISTMVFLSIPAMVTEATVQDKQTRINMSQMTFEEIITELSKIFDMEISLVGTSNLPQHKFNLTLEQVTFKQAIKEGMRMASVQSHILVWNQENRGVQIWILRSASGPIEETSQANHDKNPEVLSLAQMQQLEPDDDDLNHSPLTAEQMQQLDPDDDDRKANKTLNKEQMQLLDQEEDNKAMTLSKEQMQRLTPDKKIDADNKTLTKEQMSFLEPDKMQP